MKKRNIIIVVVSIILAAAGAIWFFMFKKANLSVYIPKKAISVLKINTMSIASKLDFDEIKNMDSYNSMVDQMEEGGIDMSLLMKNPLKSGVSLKDNIYVFTELHDEKTDIGMVLGISDSKNFKDFIQKFASDSKLEYKSTDDMFMYSASDEEDSRLSIVWNDDACVFYYSNDQSLSKSKRILNQEKEESILTNETFVKSEEKGGDISLYIDYDNIHKIIEDQIENENLNDYYPKKIKNFFENIEGSTFVLNFNENHISVDGLQFFKDESKIQEFNILGEKGLDSKSIDYLTSNGKILMCLSASINMKEVFNIFKTIPKYDDGIAEIEKVIGLNETEIKNLLNGTFTVAITDIKLKDEEVESYIYNEDFTDFEIERKMVTKPVPIYCVQIGIKDVKSYDKLMSKISELSNGEITPEGNKVIIPTKSIYGDIHMVNIKDLIVITNDSAAASVIEDNKKWSHSINSDLKKLFVENPVACYVSLDIDKYGKKEFQSMFGDNNRSDKKFKIAEKFMSNFSSFSFNSSLKSSRVGIHLKKESKNNSLMRTIQAIDALVSDVKKL